MSDHHKGQIKRKAYNRRGYRRKAYTRTDGTHVKGTYIPPTHVPAAWIKDLGLPGRGPKKISMKDTRSLEEVGYHLRDTERTRHTALLKGARKHGKTWVVRRLTAVRNLQHRTNPAGARKLERDIEYVQNAKL